jgi:hypothetical protein
VKPFIKEGTQVWVLTRQHIRTGVGPRLVTVAYVQETAHLFRACGTRGWYGDREVFETQAEATTAWHERSAAEHRVETNRYNKIANRLMGWQNTTKEGLPQ